MPVYEDFFGLQQRPFNSAPSASDFVAIAPLQDALDSLVHCITQSRGIAVLTSAAGHGKTMLCKRLSQLLSQNYRTIHLHAGTADNRLGLLQAVLFEMNMGYVGLSEQEARLKLLQAARDLRPERRGMLLIIDDAERLPPRLLEELRTLSEYAPDGENLINVVVCGTFELEEILADPALSSFNQRIGLQLCLSPLSLEDSARYISERLKACGAANILEIIDEEALESVCRVSDGNMRCLNQLMDQSCLLAFANAQRPINLNTVRGALKSLKDLPLRWNDLPEEEPVITSADDWLADLHEEAELHIRPSQIVPIPPTELETDEFPIPEFLRASSGEEQAETQSDTLPIQSETVQEKASTQSVPTEIPEFAVYEIGAGISEETSSLETTSMDSPSERHSDDSESVHVFEFPQVKYEGVTGSTTSDELNMVEIPVVDRYTLLDRLYELPDDRRHTVNLSSLDEIPVSETRSAPSHVEFPREGGIPESELLELVQSIRNDIRQLRSEHHEQHQQHDFRGPFQSQTLLTPQAVASKRATETKLDEETEAQKPPRRFEQLFTRLRLRRRKAESEQQSND
jgi:Type II secretory pathway, component ExeA (predicted ATPase)